MRLAGVVYGTVLALAGCAGVQISPTTPASADAAHASPGAPDGYVVYEPMLVVQVAREVVCAGKNKGNCAEPQVRCTISEPAKWPDYDRPYRVNIRPGLGKTSVDLEIRDGWMLGQVKDQTDNTILWNTFSSLATAAIKKLHNVDVKPPQTCFGVAPGLYRLDRKSRRLVPLDFAPAAAGGKPR